MEAIAMNTKQFPVIDPIATGKNIIRLRVERGMSVRDLQAYFGFEEPQAIYKWQQGKSLPSVDNLYALGALFEVPMEDILVSRTSKLNLMICEQQAEACCSPLFMGAPTITDTAESQDRFDHFCQGHALAGSLRSEGSIPRRINGSKASNIKIGNLSISNRIGRCEVARSRFGVSVFTIW